MKFTFESVDSSQYTGGSYLMDFEGTIEAADAAIVEGKLLTVFGTPAAMSEDYENSFNYYIRATAEDGRSVVLNVYGIGAIHIGAEKDDFAIQAGNALIEYVNAAVPTDYQRTVYYLDFDLQIDISVKNGIANVSVEQLPEEKISEISAEWYK
ncbi:MAG: hypothetical protein E7638_05345 [Ruminococcaceae bacterium]|nr:hypothetical protein [Oscillospiraceae bacterium]